MRCYTRLMMRSLLIDLNDDALTRIEIDRELPLGDLEGESGEPIRVRSAVLRAVAQRTGRGMELEGRLAARVELTCSRCLEPFEAALDEPLFLILVAAAESTDEGAWPGGPRETVVEAQDDDAAVFEAEGGRADLRRIATEQIYLNLPLKPVCADSCRGLCPTCGANRNRIECGCRSALGDPRLAGLGDLEERLRGS